MDKIYKKILNHEYEVYEGTEVNRPTAGLRGRYYLCTDTNKWCWDNGSDWIEIPSSETRIVYRQIACSDETLTTGDGKEYFIVPDYYDGWEITEVGGAVANPSSSSAPTFQIHNLTDGVDILSTPITIDANEYTSDFASTAPVINSSYSILATGDVIRYDCDEDGYGTEGGFIWMKITAA